MATNFRSLRVVPVLALVVAACAPSHALIGGRPSALPAMQATATQSPRIEPEKTPRPPVPVITTAMPGEPAGASLSEVRLNVSSCEEHQSIVDARIKRMRAEVDAEFRRWHDEQPACWAEDRRRDAERRANEACAASGDCSFGFGLMGVGEGGGGYGEGIGLGSIGTIGHGSGSGPRAATSISRTNNQVAAVDEADIVKTDGRYVYIVANGALRILEAMSPRVLSVTKLSGDVREMLVEGDRAVVFVASAAGEPRCKYGYDCTVAGDGTSTRVVVFDITNRSAPKSIRQIELTGSLIASRRIGTTVHTVVADGDTLSGEYETWPTELEMFGTMEPIVVAKFAKLKAENERKIRANTSLPKMVDRGVATPLCSGLLEAKSDASHTFTTLVSFDMHDAAVPAKTATVRSRPGAVFASEDALYFSAWRKKSQGAWHAFYPSADEVSEVHKFRIGMHPSDTRYIGSGVVPGHVLNQFSMDEWHGYLRIATTKGKVPSPDVESAVSILAEGEAGNLVRVGAAEHIARGEDIRAVRFDDDRGYIVTFKKTDPLFVLDLYDVAHPAVLGELKIPGFSTYLHRIDATHLLSIGFDANDHGDFAYFDGVLLQLFDVTNPMDPKLLHREKLGTRGSSSEAATDHLAFNYFPDKGLLALPMTICEGGGDGRNGTEQSFSGLVVYRVDLAAGFTRLGGIDHAKSGASCGTWWSHANSTVKRSLFLDDLVYSMAMDRVKVQRLGAFGKDVADITLLP